MSERAHWEEINELEAKLAVAEARAERAEALLKDAVEALKPFAAFADGWDAQPLRGVDDRLYSLHGTTHLCLSDCKAARAVLDKVQG